MISFIIPFASKGDNLYQRRDMDEGMIILSTILSIKNIIKLNWYRLENFYLLKISLKE